MTNFLNGLREDIGNYLLAAPKRDRGSKFVLGLGVLTLVFWIALTYGSEEGDWTHPTVLVAPVLISVGAAELLPESRWVLIASLRLLGHLIAISFIIWGLSGLILQRT